MDTYSEEFKVDLCSEHDAQERAESLHKKLKEYFGGNHVSSI